MEIDSGAYISWFRHSSPYINAHRGRTVVLMLSGEAIAHDNFANIVHDIALLNSLGVRLVICHGARSQIEARVRERGIGSQFHQGLRITDLETLHCISEAVGGVRSKIEALLSMGLPNSPMHGAKIRVVSGNFVTAKPLGIIDGVDFQHTGEVRRIDSESIQRFLDTGHIVLLSPLGYSSTGEMFNLSLEQLAVATANTLRADKLVGFEASPGLLDDQQQLIRELDLYQAEQYQQQAPFDSLRAIIQACQAQLPRGHIISYAEDGALLQELYTRDGSGTLISKGSYEQIRQATIDDVGGILELIEPLEADGTLVKRSRELLENEIHHFAVMDRDGMAVACAALYPYAESRSAELACVVAHPDYRGGQRAARLLLHLENSARQQGIDTVFVLTTRTAHWFIEQGFQPGSVHDLPPQKQQLYNLQRNSKVFVKTLR